LKAIKQAEINDDLDNEIDEDIDNEINEVDQD